MDYVEAVRGFFQVYPVDTLKCLMKKDNSNTNSDKQGDVIKEKEFRLWVYSYIVVSLFWIPMIDLWKL